MRSPTMQPDHYRDQNAALFAQRTELLEELGSYDDESVGSRRRVRMLRRQIDDVTAEIVSSNMGLVRSYTRRFGATASAHDRADFESAGLLGLMRAIDSFDPESGSFGHWAFKPIQREVLRAVRDCDHPNLNRSDFEKRPLILSTFRKLQQIDESYTPSFEEVAAAAGVTLAQTKRVLDPVHLQSMSEHVGGESDVRYEDVIESLDTTPEAAVISTLMLSALERFGLSSLDARELYVIVRRFGLDGEPVEKLADIGETLSLSREAVRQIEAKALAKLQHPLVLSHMVDDFGDERHQPAPKRCDQTADISA
jgi:RNA polymerase sigma factor (sigma-70 family)